MTFSQNDEIKNLGLDYLPTGHSGSEYIGLIFFLIRQSKIVWTLCGPINYLKHMAFVKGVKAGRVVLTK